MTMLLKKLVCCLALTLALAGVAETAPSASSSPFRNKKFSVSRETFKWRGQEVKFFEWLPAFSLKLGNCLRASELSSITGECVLDARIVVLEDVVAPGTNTASSSSSPFMTISYQVRHGVTSRVKAKGEVSLDALAFSATDVKAFIEQTADAAANILSDSLIADMLPPEVVGRNSQNLLIVKGGAKALRAGEFLTVFVRGEEIKDAATGKVVDWKEEAIGTVQIVRVSSDGSHAQIVEGDAKRMTIGARLRRVQAR